jgi:hypothetical protein
MEVRNKVNILEVANCTASSRIDKLAITKLNGCKVRYEVVEVT